MRHRSYGPSLEVELDTRPWGYGADHVRVDFGGLVDHTDKPVRLAAIIDLGPRDHAWRLSVTIWGELAFDLADSLMKARNRREDRRAS